MSDEELIVELRKPWFTNGCELYQLTAADRIEALVKERDARPTWQQWKDVVAAGYEQKARAERLEVRCKALIAAYDKANWMRTADYHGDECDCLRCHVDYLRTALKGEEP